MRFVSPYIGLVCQIFTDGIGTTQTWRERARHVHTRDGLCHLHSHHGHFDGPTGEIHARAFGHTSEFGARLVLVRSLSRVRYASSAQHQIGAQDLWYHLILWLQIFRVLHILDLLIGKSGLNSINRIIRYILCLDHEYRFQVFVLILNKSFTKRLKWRFFVWNILTITMVTEGTRDLCDFGSTKWLDYKIEK